MIDTVVYVLIGFVVGLIAGYLIGFMWGEDYGMQAVYAWLAAKKHCERCQKSHISQR